MSVLGREGTWWSEAIRGAERYEKATRDGLSRFIWSRSDENVGMVVVVGSAFHSTTDYDFKSFLCEVTS